MDKEKHVILGVTGHRILTHSEDKIKAILTEKMHQFKPDLVLTGMALGFDMLVAESCVELTIPFSAMIPFQGQTKNWNPKQKKKWRDLMSRAKYITLVSPGKYAAWKYHARNQKIVNDSTLMLCYWDGKEVGGTYECLKYATKKGLPVENLYDLLVV